MAKAKSVVIPQDSEYPKGMIGDRIECKTYPKNTIEVSRDKFGMWYLYINGKFIEQNEKYMAFVPTIKKFSK